MTSRQVTQVATWENREAAALWRKTSAHRAAYMAITTATLLDVAGVSEGARILSVGCGTGEEAIAAAVRVGPRGHVVGTDLSSAMIEIAAERATESHVTNVSFQVMDTQHLDFPSASFDAVISRNSIMFVPDIPGALSEIRRVLRPTGKVGITVWSDAARNPRIAGPLAAATAILGTRLPESVTYRVALRLSRPPLLVSALRGAGFHGVSVQRVSLSAPYADLDEAVSAALESSATQDLIRILPAGAAERMRVSLRRRWARYSTPDGTHLPGEQLVAGASVGMS